MADQRKNPFKQNNIDEPKKSLQGSVKRLHESTTATQLVSDSKNVKTNIDKKDFSTNLSNSAFGDILGNPGGKAKKTLMTGIIAVVVSSLVSIPANAVEPMIPAESVVLDDNGIVHNIVPGSDSTPDSGHLNKVVEVPVQVFVTPDAPDPSVLDLSIEVAVDEEVVAREKAEAEAEKAREEAAATAAAESARVEAERSAQASQQASRSTPQASGAGRTDIANAAASQLGVRQDCTDLVQYALAAVGINATRANGGYDFGTQVHEFTQFGGKVVYDGFKPGDILVWPGVHVAVYFGNGQIVHGGWVGDQTVMNDWMTNPNPVVVRF